jgi:hypothetical protein
MTDIARGTFEVKLVPQPSDRQPEDGVLGRGAPSLTITVVPDSGTEEPAGLSGQRTIIITDGKHSHELEYALHAAQ